MARQRQQFAVSLPEPTGDIPEPFLRRAGQILNVTPVQAIFARGKRDPLAGLIVSRNASVSPGNAWAVAPHSPE